MADPVTTETATTTATTDAGSRSSVAAQRAATLAALEADEHLGDKEEKAEPEKKDADAEPTEKESPKEPDEDDTEEDEDKAEADAKADPDLEKRLAQVQKASKRDRELLAKERADAKAEIERDVARVRAEWEPRIKAAQEFEQLKGRVKYGVVEVLTHLGLTEADYHDASRELFAASPEGQKDPKWKAAVAARLAAKEQGDKLSATDKRIAELEKKLAEKEASEAQSREATAYMAKVEKSVGESSPLTRRLMDKNPDKASAELSRMAQDMIRETGELPGPGDVVAAYEKRRRAELEELGVDLSDAAKPVIKKVAPTATAKADPHVNGTATASPKTLRERREETRRLLEQGKFD